MNIPAELRYTKEHEWIRVEGDVAYVGITDYAQSELGEIVFVDINTEGETVNQNEVFGSVEAVKTVSDLNMPVTGEVLEVNETINDQPELVNNDPYGEGWMIKIQVADPAELDTLLDAAAYQVTTVLLGFSNPNSISLAVCSLLVYIFIIPILFIYIFN